MSGRKSSRGAAVVLAGCVGLALAAPGLAVAQEDTPSDPCSGPLASVLCSGGSSSGSSGGTTTDESSSPTVETPPPATSTDDPTSPLPIDLPDLSELPTGSTAGSDAAVPESGTGSGTTGSGTTGSGTTGTGTAALPALVATPSAVEAGAEDLQDQLTGLLPGLPTVPGLPAVPGNLQFPTGFDVPTSIPTGGFTNPQEACAFLAGSVTVSEADAAGLGTAFSQFCGALPASFDPSGLGGLTDLLDLLEGLLGGLVPTLPGTPPGDGTIPSNPPSSAPVSFHGYWTKRYDVDCADVTFDEAQDIYAADRSDPFRLDRDDDGTACDRNATVVNVENYSGYPRGGVSTGDATTGGSPAGVALAAMTLSFLALGGVALVRRFAREA